MKDEVVLAHVIRVYVGVELKFHSFLTSTLLGNKWSASRSSRFILR
jgi:hypothetical protein